ncbi:MAG: hypothetical protein ACI9L9_000391 [Marivirga sp.]
MNMTSLDNKDVLSAWKALSGSYEDDGWRSIPIVKLDHCTVLAARKFPGNEEAILLDFTSARIQPTRLLPQSKGFKIEKSALATNDKTEQELLSLVRQPQGDLGLFSQMSSDIISTLSSSTDQSGERLYQLFLMRVKTWQEFMKKSQTCLSPAEELGLMGELEALSFFLQENIPPHLVVESWVGPVDGIQDFNLGSGAVEVKSTLSKEGFSAQIMSLNQLDDSVVAPIYLYGCYFSLDPEGRSLPQTVSELRGNLEEHSSVLESFNSILFRAGYLDSHAKDYSRSFSCEKYQIWIINESFPRLVPSNVPLNVRQVRYEIDLTGLDDNLVSTEKMLKSLEVL